MHTCGGSRRLRQRWRHLTDARGRQQAIGCYLWDEQTGAYVGRIIDVLTLRGDRIAAITAFVDATLFPRFGLPKTPPASAAR